MRIAGIAAAVAVSFVFVPLAAHAESKAWTAAKANLPADAKIVVGLDLAAIQKTQLFAAYYPKLLAKADGSKVIDTMKAACKLDPLTSVQSVVIASADKDNDGAAFIALAGIDKAKLSACLPLAIQAGQASKDKAAKDAKEPAKDPKDAKVVITHDGNITTITQGGHTAYVGWIGTNVVVVPFQSEKKESITRWLGGKGALAKTTLSKTIGKVNTSAALWGAGDVTKELQPGMTVKGGYGAVTFAKGNLDADAHAVMASAEQATKLAGDAKLQVEQAQKAGAMPPAIASLVKAVVISAANDEVVVKANVAETDLKVVLDMAMASLGGS